MSKSILQLKVRLIATDPSVWRRILVPSDYSFADLHVVLQDAVGWTDSHLHHFLTANPYKRDTKYRRISPPMPTIDVPDEDPDLDEEGEKLSGWLKKPNDLVYYEYDFGDSWMHEVMLEKVLPADQKERYPQLVDGANACPPEDCGGPGGYAHLIEVLSDPDDDEHEDMLEWLDIDDPKEIDPTLFDLKRAAARVANKRSYR